MAIVYRTLHPDEADALVALRAAVLGTPPDIGAQLFSDFGADTRRHDHTLVAVAPDGRLLAAVGYWLREVWDNAGTPQRVGHIFGVATHPDVRQRGHAGQLLERAIDAMRQEGCAWSVLFTREAARPLYTRHGWNSYPGSVRSITTAVVPDHADLRYVARPVAPDLAPWEALAAIYDAFNARRPLTLARSPAYWHGYASWMLADWMAHHSARLLIATDAASGQPCAYAIAHIYDAAAAQQHFGSPPWFFVSELGVLPDQTEALPALITAILTEAARCGAAGYSQWDVPDAPAVNEALTMLGGGMVETITLPGSLMARPIVATWTQLDLDRLLAAPGSIFWSLDRY